VSLWKRGKVWWVYFYIDGIRQQYSTNTGNRKQAQKILDKLKTEANARRHQLIEVDPDMTFGGLAARFIASGIARPHHLYHLKILLPYFSEIPILRLNKAQAEEFRRRRQTNKQLKDATVNRDLSVLRRVLYWALDESLILVNPLARMRMARERRTRRQVLSVEEEERLLAVAPAHLQAMIIAALDTGMRRGEITSQRWEHIDFSRRLLFVTRSKTPQGEDREIPLSQRLCDLLVRTRKEDGIVFTYQGNPVRIIKTTWRSTLRRAGIRHIRFHDLRHTFNTRLMEAGVMQEVRMALMGHSSGQKVHSTYVHVELPVKREAIARLDEWMKHQRAQGGQNARSQTETSTTSRDGVRTEAVEEEDTG